MLPLSICVPAGGAVRVTCPVGTLSEASRLTVTLKPAASSFLRACDCVSPSTLGTAACPGPPDTVSDTVEPSSALVLGCGSWRRILSRCSGEITVVTCVLKPLFSRIALPTASWVPTTPGTLTCLGDRGPRSRNNAARTASTPSTAAIHGHRRRRSSSSGGGPSSAPSTSGSSIGMPAAASAVGSVNGAAIAPNAAVDWPAGIWPSWARTISSAAMNSSASAKRCSGSFSRARSTTASSSAVTAALYADGGTGASETCLRAMVTALSPSNGTRPASIS